MAQEFWYKPVIGPTNRFDTLYLVEFRLPENGDYLMLDHWHPNAGNFVLPMFNERHRNADLLYSVAVGEIYQGRIRTYETEKVS